MAVASILDFGGCLSASLLGEVVARCYRTFSHGHIGCRSEYAICVFCGERKTDYDASCAACCRAPASAHEFAKSLLLSSDFQWDEMGFPKSSEELVMLGECIASGGRDCVSEEDVEATVKHLSELDAYRRRWTLPIVLLFWFIPAMLLVAFVVYLVVQVVAA
jgi:hypothetical protein